jgi:cell volume regulation protein A
VFTLATAFLAFSVPTLLGGSGFLGVYAAGVVVGSGRLPYRASLLGVHDGLAWLSQVAMFLLLGLLVFPSRLSSVAQPGLLIAVGLAVVARPVVVALCLAPFRFRRNEILYIGWVGLRGAVPVILATYPVLVGVPGAERMFDLVFIVVVVNALLPGMTVPWVTRRLGVESDEPPTAQAVLQVESVAELNGSLLSYYVDEALGVAGSPLSDLEFPEGAAVTMIVRGRDLIAPKGATQLEVGDHVYVVTTDGARPFVQLMFGRPESGS